MRFPGNYNVPDDAIVNIYSISSNAVKDVQVRMRRALTKAEVFQVCAWEDFLSPGCVEKFLDPNSKTAWPDEYVKEWASLYVKDKESKHTRQADNSLQARLCVHTHMLIVE